MKHDSRGERDLPAALRSGFERHRRAMDGLGQGPALERLADLTRLVRDVLAAGGKILACGNGGSAADAQHFAAELVGRYRDERPALAAMALTSDGAVLTCLANDYDYDRVFARQVEALGRPGDLLVGISTSGSSPSVVRALETARSRGLKTAALLGRDGGAALRHADLPIVVAGDETARIQEGHALLIHLLCEGLDLLLGTERRPVP
ncbi:MAG TPA: SIS domain-containing protein [Candidatus Polarisedimenticolia bacterium]|nr:SIS domain-containing protein [Candidatus Polarisedimenticolia bacterium]